MVGPVAVLISLTTIIFAYGCRAKPLAQASRLCSVAL